MGIIGPASKIVRLYSRLMLRFGQPDRSLSILDLFRRPQALTARLAPAKDRQYLRVARALQQGSWTVDFGEPLASDIDAYERHFAGLERYRGWFAPGKILHRCFFGTVPQRPLGRTWAAPVDRPVRVLVVARNAAKQGFIAEPIRALTDHGAEVRIHDAQPLVDTRGTALRGRPDIAPIYLYARGEAPSSPDAMAAYVRAADPALWDSISWADVVFVEWANQTALWLSRCLPWTKKLVVRCHSYEALTTFPLFLNHGRIDTLMFIAPHVRAIYATHPVDDPQVFDRSVIVQNVRPPEHPAPALPPDERRFRLGMLGFDRQIKDPLYALSILRALVQQDKRWRLVLGGNDLPEPAADDTSPSAGYIRAFRMAYDDLRGHIEFSGYITDKAPWFAGIGFILSTSLREGSHEAVVEGMAHGCIPVLRDWPMAKRFGGAAGSFPGLQIHDTPEAAAAQILRDTEVFPARSVEMAHLAQTHYFGKNARDHFAATVLADVDDDQKGTAT